jgi:hypothetical protein
VFARLLTDGLLSESELSELSPDKIAQIRSIIH